MSSPLFGLVDGAASGRDRRAGRRLSSVSWARSSAAGRKDLAWYGYEQKRARSGEACTRDASRLEWDSYVER